jgi:hypothetical protein
MKICIATTPSLENVRQTNKQTKPIIFNALLLALPTTKAKDILLCSDSL